MILKVGVGGSEGRMGKSLIGVIALDSEVQCVLPIDRSCDLETGLKQSDIDVFIDFTEPSAAIRHLELCCQYRLPLVLGVTGFSSDQKEKIQKAAIHIPIVFSPNFSLGINLTFKLLEYTASLLKTFKTLNIPVDIAIQEMHHKHKKDKPSGTSKRMGEIISAEDYISCRIGDIVGEHSVILAFEGERIEITHHAQDRLIYAKGAMIAAKWLGTHKPNPGLYDMQKILEALC